MALKKDELQERFAKVSYLQNLLHSIYSDVHDSYEVLRKYDGDIKYSLSLNFLNMSHQSYIEFKRVYYQNGLEHYEIDTFIKDYENYKLQLKAVITQKDTSDSSWSVKSVLNALAETLTDNTYSLRSTLDTFTNTKESVDEFLSNWIKKHEIK